MLASHEIGRGSDDNLAVQGVKYGVHSAQRSREVRHRRRNIRALFGAQEPRQREGRYHMIRVAKQGPIAATRHQIHVRKKGHLQPDIV